MSNDTTLSALMLIMMLLLPLASLLARRPPIGATLRMAAAWIGIFGIGLILASAYTRSGIRVQDAAVMLGLSDQIVTGTNVIIPRDAQGHFSTTVKINGSSHRMMIDTGATVTSIPAAVALAASVEIDAGFGVMVDTANGTVMAHRATVKDFRLGPIQASDFALQVMDGLHEGVVGMNFLSELRSWRVEGNIMILEPGRSGPSEI